MSGELEKGSKTNKSNLSKISEHTPAEQVGSVASVDIPDLDGRRRSSVGPLKRELNFTELWGKHYWRQFTSVTPGTVEISNHKQFTKFINIKSFHSNFYTDGNCVANKLNEKQKVKKSRDALNRRICRNENERKMYTKMYVRVFDRILFFQPMKNEKQKEEKRAKYFR